MNGLLISEGIVHSFSDLRSSIFSTDTPGKQGPPTAGRRRDDTLWTNQSNVDVDVDDTNNEGRWWSEFFLDLDWRKIDFDLGMFEFV